MNSNEILDEIRRTRDATMAACGGDLQHLVDHYRRSETRWAAAGHPIVSLIGQPHVDLPLPDWEKIDATPENEIIAEIRATRRRMLRDGGDHPPDTRFKAAPRAKEANSGIVGENPPEA